MTSNSQTLPNNNSTHFSQMTNQELDHLITNGQPGNQRSRDAILELLRRNHTIKNELKHLWGIVPERKTESSHLPFEKSDVSKRADIRNMDEDLRSARRILFDIAFVIIINIIVIISLISSESSSISISISIFVTSIILISFRSGIAGYSVADSIERAAIRRKVIIAIVSGIVLGIAVWVVTILSHGV